MEFITKTPNQFTERDVDQLSHLAGIGFGQGDSPAMRQDSINHINASEHIQLVSTNNELVGFSMVRSCLWR